MSHKNKGVYYTPQKLSDFMAQHSLAAYSGERDLAILEPSCGDGVFVEALNSSLVLQTKQSHSIECIEIDKPALIEAKTRPQHKFRKATFINTDFFDFIPKQIKKYDLIIGNPPYVVRKRLSNETVEACRAVYAKSDLSDKYFRNLWGAFLVGSIDLLSDNGILAFILPAELLQVKYSEELRSLLINKFERVEIVSFKEIIFENIEQDTVLLFCYKRHSDKGLFFSQQKNVNSLIKKKLKFRRKELKTMENVKWTSHILTQEELSLLLKLKKRFQPVSHYCTAVAGIVTAANNFFIVDDETLEKYGLEEFALPIIQRGMYINGSAVFTQENLNSLKTKGKACNLLDFKGINNGDLNKKIKSYLDFGKDQNIDQRYKCQKRPVWYSIPGIWESEGFFFKRSHLYPKILTNEARVLVTDSAYRIKMLEGNCINSLVYSFYNSLTLSLAELGGRSYGGGVLELTPNEFKSISIPYTKIEKNAFKDFSKRFENKQAIDEILADFDQKILSGVYGLDNQTILKLQKIKKKLTQQRLNKSQP